MNSYYGSLLKIIYAVFVFVVDFWSTPLTNNGLYVYAFKISPIIYTLATKNKTDATQSCRKTLSPSSSKPFAHSSQCTSVQNHKVINCNPFHLNFNVVAGKTSGNKQQYHKKYCAVQTLHHATNTYVPRKIAKGRSWPYFMPIDTHSTTCGKNANKPVFREALLVCGPFEASLAYDRYIS